MSDRVCIGSCVGPADAAVVRAMLAGHGIASVVTGEQHANVLGGMAGGLISLDIWVAAADAEQAAELLRDFRAGGEAADGADDAAADGGEAGDGEGEEDAGDEDVAVEIRVERRKRTGVALLLGACVTFGTAHMYAGAWKRGVALAAIDILAFRQLVTTFAPLAAAIWCASIVVDILGAALQIRADTPRTTLPRATLRP